MVMFLRQKPFPWKHFLQVVNAQKYRYLKQYKVQNIKVCCYALPDYGDRHIKKMSALLRRMQKERDL